MVTKEERLMYACSGAADVGELSDRVVRKMRADGIGAMSCLAAIGADIENYKKTAQGMPQVIAVDGCPMLCAKKNLERIGVKPLSYMLTDMGCEKGKTPAIEGTVNAITAQIEQEVLSR